MEIPDRIQEGLKLRNAHNLLLLWTPNILNPHKLFANLRHPIHEVFHTNHKQRPIERKKHAQYYVVEHRLRDRLVTVDVVSPTQFPKGLIPRVKQLFDRNFYYGHDRDFPQPFTLINRTFVRGEFNEENYSKRIVGSHRKLRRAQEDFLNASQSFQQNTV